MDNSAAAAGASGGSWALEAALAADQVAVAVQRLSESLSVTDCQAHLQAALAQVRSLGEQVRAAGGQGVPASLAADELRRLRRNLALFQTLMRTLLAHRAELARRQAVAPDAALPGESPGVGAASYGHEARGPAEPVRFCVEG